MLGGLKNIEIKPLVIFGAGASYDLVPPHAKNSYREFIHNPYRPPLANEIFNKNIAFRKILSEYPNMSSLVGDVNSRMINGQSFEEVLEDIKNKKSFTRDMPFLKKYLLNLFLVISNNNHQWPGDNYCTFLKYMQEICDEYFIVNFNYDSLAQIALSKSTESKFENINSYIENKIKLIHPHGSVKWIHNNEGGSVRTNINNNSVPIDSDNVAITIPTTNGKDFVCPSSHTEALQLYMLKVNVIIIIGWKGMESHFNKIFKGINDCPARIILVSGNEKPDREILKNSGLDRFDCEKVYVNGFSNLIKSYPDFSKKPKNEHFLPNQ